METLCQSWWFWFVVLVSYSVTVFGALMLGFMSGRARTEAKALEVVAAMNTKIAEGLERERTLRFENMKLNGLEV
jgi:hypothetical protein